MNVFSSPRFRLGWILIAIGLINSLVWLLVRWNFENSYTRTQITLDYDDTRAMADAYGIPHNTLLKAFRQAGATSLAIYNQSLVNLRDNGRVAITPREEAERLYPSSPWRTLPASYRYLISATPDNSSLIVQILGRLQEQSQTVLPPRVLRLRTANPKNPADVAQWGIVIPASRQLFNDAQLGFDPAQLAVAKKAGYAVTARLSNSLNLTPERLNRMLDDAQQAKAKVVIFSEDEVLGYDSLMSTAAREMRARGLIFANIEFTKQRGWQDFAKNTEGLLARVHSVAGDEAAKAKPEVLVDRYVRAVKERDIRVAYIRLIRQLKGEPKPIEPGEKLTSGKPLVLEKTPYQQNLDFIKQVREELERPALPLTFLRPGLQMGEAQAFGDYPLSVLSPTFGDRGAKIIRYLGLFLTGLGVVGATLLLLNLFFDFSPSARRSWAIAGVILVAALSVSTGKGAQLMALEAGMTAPVVAILWGGLPLLWDGLRRENEGPSLTVGEAALLGFKILLKTTLLTLIGGLFVVALLNNWKYMSKADEFFGEKATQFIPLFLVPLAFLGELFPHRVEEAGADAGRKRALARMNNALSKPFTARVAIVSILVLAGGYLWMARFGNESGMEISPLELKMRAILEKVFVTRPRTKEIFMGHPAFLFAVYFLLRRQKLLAWCAIVLATIGQADVLNTMCHIHTPVFYSLWRSLTGVVLGSLIGWVALLVFDAVAKRRAPRSVA